MTKTAIIAGQGALPGLMVAALSARREAFLLAELDGFPAMVDGHCALTFRLERLVPFLDHLLDEGVTRAVFAGSVRRPKLEPELFDARTAAVFPQVLEALNKGDDAALRALAALFEDFGLPIAGADDVLPDLVPGPGILTGAPSDQDRADAARAAEIVAALGPLDLGQGAVVAGGLCLAVETLPGTDAMLAFTAERAQPLRADRDRAKGVFYKAPKPGQDRRVDLPALGVDTVRAAARAGLAGIAWEAGGVLLLDRDAMLAEAQASNLFLWSRQP